MSQKTQNPAPNAPTSEHKQKAPITGVSPDDPFPVPSDQTGQPGAPTK